LGQGHLAWDGNGRIGSSTNEDQDIGKKARSSAGVAAAAVSSGLVNDTCDDMPRHVSDVAQVDNGYPARRASDVAQVDTGYPVTPPRMNVPSRAIAADNERPTDEAYQCTPVATPCRKRQVRAASATKRPISEHGRGVRPGGARPALAFGSLVTNDSRPSSASRPPTAVRSSSVPSPAKSPAKLSAARFDAAPIANAFSVSGSNFVREYARGALPCRISHGTRDLKLSWDTSTEDLDSRRGSLLALCAEGLCEARHPHLTVARLAFAELAALHENSSPLDADTLRRVMGNLRKALFLPGSSERNNRTGNHVMPFDAAIMALRQLVKAEGSRLVPHLHVVLPPIGKRMFCRHDRAAVQDALQDLAEYGGPEAEKVMLARGVVDGIR